MNRKVDKTGDSERLCDTPFTFMPCNWSSDSSSAASQIKNGLSNRQLAWRLENLEEKVDRLTDLCYKGHNDSMKRPGPRRATCCTPKRDQSPRRNMVENLTLSAADQQLLGDLDRYMIIGEMLFQFERRIFNVVIPKNQRFYGYAVRNIEQLIAREDAFADRVQFRCNLSRLNDQLRPLGYLPHYHSELSSSIINEYGVLARSATHIRAMSGKLENVAFLKRLISATLPLSLREDVLKLFNCLVFLTDQAGGDCKLFRF